MNKATTVKSTKRNTGLKAPWKPGQSGNPNGRPKNADTLAFWLRQYGNLKLPKKLPVQWEKSLLNWRKAGFPEPTTLIELEAVQLWADTLDGNDFARREKNDRMYGKPSQMLTDREGNEVAPLYVRLDASMESNLKAANH